LKRVLPLLVLVVAPLRSTTVWADPASRPPVAASRPASRPAGARGPTEYRFDALRIDGALHGPEALVVRSMTGSSRKPLLRRRRSFVFRILETLEDPGLHRAAAVR
jgi:hypothetical protein